MSAITEMRPLPQGREYTAYQITGETRGEVQGKITEIMEGHNVCMSEFRDPWLLQGGLYRSHGYVRRRLFPAT